MHHPGSRSAKVFAAITNGPKLRININVVPPNITAAQKKSPMARANSSEKRRRSCIDIPPTNRQHIGRV